MNSLLRLIDIYGKNIPLTFYRKDKYKSSCGGILTLIIIVATIGMAVIEMTPIYSRLNPQVFNKMIDPDSNSYHNLTYKNFPIAFRFEDESKNVKDLTGIVYPYTELIHMKLDKATGNMILEDSKVISYSDCTEDQISRDLFPNLNGFKCLNFSEFDEEVGGGLYSDESIYFKITVFYCALVNGKHENCTDYETLSHELSGKKKIYFTMLIPDVSTNPDDLERPLKITVDSYINTLSPLIMRTDRYYYNSIELECDSGWIFKKLENFPGFAFFRKDVEYQLRTIEDFKNPNKIKTLSTNVFAIQKRIYKTKVVFKKLQNGLADVGGLIKLFSLAFLILNCFIIDEFKFFRLIDDLYEIKINKRIVQEICMKKGNLHELNKKIEKQNNKINRRKALKFNNALPPLKQQNQDRIKCDNDDKRHLLRGIYFDINNLNVKKEYTKVELNCLKNSTVIKEDELIGNSYKIHNNNGNFESVFNHGKNNLYKNNLIAELGKSGNTTEQIKNSGEMISCENNNINKNKNINGFKKNSGFSHQTKDNSLISTVCFNNNLIADNNTNCNNNINKSNINEKTINNNKNPDKRSFKDKDSNFSDDLILNKKSDRNYNYSKNSIISDNSVNINLRDNLKKINLTNLNLFTKANFEDNLNNNNRDLNIANNFQDEMEIRNKIYFSDYFIISIRYIFNLKDKIKLLLCKNDRNKKKNFRIYYQEKEIIDEKMDLINFLKMSLKFEEVVEAIEVKKNEGCDIYNFQKDMICFE